MFQRILLVPIFLEMMERIDILDDRDLPQDAFQPVSLVDMGITPHIPIQNRTCAINAYGFSLYISYAIYKTNSL